MTCQVFLTFRLQVNLRPITCKVRHRLLVLKRHIGHASTTAVTEPPTTTHTTIATTKCHRVPTCDSGAFITTPSMSRRSVSPWPRARARTRSLGVESARQMARRFRLPSPRSEGLPTVVVRSPPNRKNLLICITQCVDRTSIPVGKRRRRGGVWGAGNERRDRHHGHHLGHTVD